MNSYKEKEKLIFIAALSAVFSQVHIGMFIDNFNISFGIVVLIIFFHIENVEEKLKVGVICGVLVCFSRTFIYFLKFNGQLHYFKIGLINYFPEVVFYMSYVVIYIFFNKRIKSINKLFFYAIVCDFFSNVMELVLRQYILKEGIEFSVVIGLVIVAVSRSFFIWVILNLMNRYNVKLLKKEHRIRYMRLLVATSRMKSEIYLMEKTMENIEDVMSKSYVLYNEIKEDKEHHDWEQAAVCITKDIHEVKKQLALITRGITEITDDRANWKVMEFYDLIDLVNEMMMPVLRDNNIKLHIYKGGNFTTKHHYYLISLFRNMINNAIDSIDGDSGDIYLDHEIDNESEDAVHIFYLRDNGKGIDKADVDNIFNPGFSTKINFETGSINRGLGLSIVKDIVEDKLKGTVRVTSVKEIGTEFVILIPKYTLEE